MSIIDETIKELVEKGILKEKGNVPKFRPRQVKELRKKRRIKNDKNKSW